MTETQSCPPAYPTGKKAEEWIPLGVSARVAG